MIPVAGRRRGQETSVTPPVAAEDASSQREDQPDWLFGLDDGNSHTNTGNNNNNTHRGHTVGASTGATAPVSSTVPSAEDTLAFLEFDDESTAAPTGLPPLSAAPSASTFLAPSSLPHTGALGSGGGEAEAGSAPFFLVHGTGANDVIPSPSHLTSLYSSLKSRWEEMQRESQAIQLELLESEKCTKLLESTEDELCKEVKTLEEEVRVKKMKEEQLEALLMSAKETLEEKRRQHHGDSNVCQRREFDEQLNVLKTQYENEVREIEASVKEHEASLLSLEERHAAMSKTISMTDLFEDTLHQIGEKLGEGIHRMGTSMCIRVKPILIDCIGDTVADSTQQRLDILSNNRQQRREELNAFRERTKKDMSEFRQERREKHKIRLDLIIGHSISQSRSALEARLATSRQQFLEQEKSVILESQRDMQRAIDEMVRRSGEDLMGLEKKFHEEFKRTESQYTAELAHHARLYTSERESGIRSQRLAEDDNAMKATTHSGYKSAEKSIKLLRERVEQLRHSVVFDIQELSSSLPRYGANNSHGIREQEVMLEECEQRTRQLSQQLQMKWEKFRSAISPLEQCINSMSNALQEGRVKYASMLQGIECVYRAWTQDVRRELSHCFTSGAASSDSVELESDLTSMTRVLDDVLNQLQRLIAFHESVYAGQKRFGFDIGQRVAELSTRRQDSDVVLESILEMYNNLARLAAEVETSQITLTLEEEKHKAAKERLERERANRNECLKSVQDLSAKLRRKTAQLETRIIPRGCTNEGTRALCDITSESTHDENTARKLGAKERQRTRELRQPLIGETTIPYLGSSAVEDVTDVSCVNKSPMGFVSLLTVEDASPIHPATEGTDGTDERRQSCDSSYALSSYRMCTGVRSRSLTTPSTSNS